MPYLTDLELAYEVLTRTVVCSECDCVSALTYIWISYCPCCGVKFDLDEDGLPKVVTKQGIIIPKEGLSGYHQLKVFGRLGVQ